MPTTNRSGIAIHFEVVGSGHPLVLLHGLTGRLEAWGMAGYVERLASDHRLVLVDARGHGLSERPADPDAYRIALQAGDVLAVLDELAIEDAALAGWAMGAATALRIAATHPHRTHAVAALGLGDAAGSVGFADVPGPEQRDDAPARDFERNGMSTVVRRLDERGEPRWARLVGRSDPGAMAACWRGSRRLDPVAARLADLETPLLFAWGELEAPPEPLPLPLGARVVELPGKDHLGAFGRSDVLAPEIRRLVASAAAERSLAGLAGALPY